MNETRVEIETTLKDCLADLSLETLARREAAFRAEIRKILGGVEAATAVPAVAAPPSPEELLPPPPAGTETGEPLLRDLAVRVCVELGRGRVSLDELRSLRHGSTLELDGEEGVTVTLRVGEQAIARGELHRIEGEWFVHVTETETEAAADAGEGAP